MTVKILLVFLVGLFLVQLILTIPFTRRLLIEIVNTIDMRVNFGRRLPFDWDYVKKGASDAH